MYHRWTLFVSTNANFQNAKKKRTMNNNTVSIKSKIMSPI